MLNVVVARAVMACVSGHLTRVPHMFAVRSLVVGDTVELLWALSFEDTGLQETEVSPVFSVAWYEMCTSVDAAASGLPADAPGVVYTTATTAGEAQLHWLPSGPAPVLTALQRGFRGSAVAWAVNVTGMLPTPNCSTASGSVAIIGARLSIYAAANASLPQQQQQLGLSRSAFDAPLMQVQRPGGGASYGAWCSNTWAAGQPSPSSWNVGLLGCPNSDKRILTGPWRSYGWCPIGLATETAPTLIGSMVTTYNSLGLTALASSVNSNNIQQGSFGNCGNNPGAISCAYAPASEDPDAPAVQCCFTPFLTANVELRTLEGRGRVMRVQPQYHPWRHLFDEVLSYTACCRWAGTDSSACAALHAARPPPFTSAQPGLPTCAASAFPPPPSTPSSSPSPSPSATATCLPSDISVLSHGCPVLCAAVAGDGTCNAPCSTLACGYDGGDCAAATADGACAAFPTRDACLWNASSSGAVLLCGWCSDAGGACLAADASSGEPASQVVAGLSCSMSGWTAPSGFTPPATSLSNVTTSGAVADCSLAGAVPTSGGATVAITWSGGSSPSLGGSVYLRIVTLQPGDGDGSDLYALVVSGYGLPDAPVANTGSFTWTVGAGVVFSPASYIAVIASDSEVNAALSPPFCINSVNASEPASALSYSWRAYTYGACSALCGDTSGTQTRTVDCVSSQGIAVPSAWCAMYAPAGPSPASSRTCIPKSSTCDASAQLALLVLSPTNGADGSSGLVVVVPSSDDINSAVNVSWSGGAGNVSISWTYWGVLGGGTAPQAGGLISAVALLPAGQLLWAPPGSMSPGFYTLTVSDGDVPDVTSPAFLVRSSVQYSGILSSGASGSGSTFPSSDCGAAVQLNGSVGSASFILPSGSGPAFGMLAPYVGVLTSLSVTPTSACTSFPLSSVTLNLTINATTSSTVFGFGPATSGALLGSPCSAKTSCLSCGAQDGCAWCDSNIIGSGNSTSARGSCQPIREATCPLSSVCTDACAAYNGSCSACATVSACAYCPLTGACSELVRRLSGAAVCPTDWAAAPCECAGSGGTRRMMNAVLLQQPRRLHAHSHADHGSSGRSGSNGGSSGSASSPPTASSSSGNQHFEAGYKAALAVALASAGKDTHPTSGAWFTGPSSDAPPVAAAAAGAAAAAAADAAPPSPHRPYSGTSTSSSSSGSGDAAPDAWLRVHEAVLPDGGYVRTATDAPISSGVLPLSDLLGLIGASSSPAAAAAASAAPGAKRSLGSGIGSSGGILCGVFALPRPPLADGETPPSVGSAPLHPRSGFISIILDSASSATSSAAAAARVSNALRHRSSFEPTILTLAASDCSDGTPAMEADTGALYLTVTGPALPFSHSSSGGGGGNSTLAVTVPVREVGFLDCFTGPGSVSHVRVHAVHMAAAVDHTLARLLLRPESGHAAPPQSNLVDGSGRPTLSDDMVHRFIGRTLKAWDDGQGGSSGSSSSGGDGEAGSSPRSERANLNLHRRLSAAPNLGVDWETAADYVFTRTPSLTLEQAAAFFKEAFPGLGGLYLGVVRDFDVNAAAAAAAEDRRLLPDTGVATYDHARELYDFNYAGDGSWSLPFSADIARSYSGSAGGDSAGASASADASANFNANVDVSAHVHMTISATLTGGVSVSSIDAGVDVSAGASFAVSVHAEAEFHVDASGDFLYSERYMRVVASIFGVPLWISLQGHLTGSFTASGDVKADFSYSATATSATYSMGMTYSGGALSSYGPEGWAPLFSPDGTPNIQLDTEDDFSAGASEW